MNIYVSVIVILESAMDSHLCFESHVSLQARRRFKKAVVIALSFPWTHSALINAAPNSSTTDKHPNVLLRCIIGA
jgi:hypothetical protein